MKHNLKTAVVAAFALGICIFNAKPVFAAKEVISSVDLSVDTSSIYSGSTSRYIEVYSESDDEYRVSGDKGSATNYPDNGWKSSSAPRFEITIKADSDYKFDTGSLKYSSYYSLGGDSVSFVKASGSSSSITLTVKMDKLTDDGNDSGYNVGDLTWDEDTGIAGWEENGASRYYVRLYRSSELIYSDTTSDNEYDFSKQINATGTYRFKVRAYDSGSYGDWEESDSFRVTSSVLSAIKSNSGGSSNGGPSGGSYTGAWLRDSTGWWYCNADRSYTVNNWQYINDKWYYFNAKGYMVTGWILWKNVWYYCGDNGDMLVNTTTPDGYRVDSNGAWIR